MNIDFDINSLKTPYYVVDQNLLVRNLEILKSVVDKTSCSILLAQKAFSMYSLYPLIGNYLDGVTASGLYEAKLGFEEMKKENHIFSPAYREEEFDEIVNICDHIVFNSFSQWEKYKKQCINSKKEVGIRINPEFSTQDHSIYDPCSKGSRLGVTFNNFKFDLLDGISGLHFHTLCEQNFEALAKTLEVVEERFGRCLKDMKWINFGGGHHITNENYDLDGLICCINKFKKKYNLKVYIEPGEAVVLNCGFLIASVLDIVNNNDENIAILDTSASCHMPDVLEMPYRPNVIGSGLPGIKTFNYLLGGPSCLAGDIIGGYSFDNKLKSGDKLIFCDMAHYSMVKNNTFNGVGLPSIAIVDKNRNLKLVKKFDYYDFKSRL